VGADQVHGLHIVGARDRLGALEGVGAIDVYRYPHWDAAAAAQAEGRAFEALDGLVPPPR